MRRLIMEGINSDPDIRRLGQVEFILEFNESTE